MNCAHLTSQKALDQVHPSEMNFWSLYMCAYFFFNWSFFFPCWNYPNHVQSTQEGWYVKWAFLLCGEWANDYRTLSFKTEQNTLGGNKRLDPIFPSACACKFLYQRRLQQGGGNYTPQVSNCLLEPCPGHPVILGVLLAGTLSHASFGLMLVGEGHEVWFYN